MSMTLDITPNKIFLYIRIGGDFSLSEANDCITNMFKAIATHNIFNALVDCRGLQGELTTFERFEHAEFAAEALKGILKTGKAHRVRLAYVGKPPLFDTEKFGETVAVNRGLNVKSFENVEEALSWLKINPGKAAGLFEQ